MDQTLINVLNGISAGLLLFMLSSGLTLIFSMMGVLNFAHASFYMLGAYFAYTLAGWLGFGPALLAAPVAVGLVGAAFERWCLRRVRRFGHVPELLVTFGFSYVALEFVQLAWGRSPAAFDPPAWLAGPAFTLVHSASDGLRLVAGAAPADLCDAASASCSPFPAKRAFMMAVALFMLGALWALLKGTRFGLVIRAALTHPRTLETLGHDVPRIFTQVFAGGCALAGLAGVIGGITFVTEPAMAAHMGTMVFVVVVVGGLGSLAGALVASLLIGLLQTMPLTVDVSLAGLAARWGWSAPQGSGPSILGLTLAQVAPILPYLLLVVVLVVRPRGLLGKREA